MSGWVKIHRAMNDWEWKTKPLTFALFVHLVTNANHREGNWRGIKLKRGQLVTGRHELAAQTGLSERQVRTALKHLISTNEVTTETTNNYSIITITNYETYQEGDQQSDQQSDQQQTNERPTSDHKQEGKKARRQEKIIARPADVPEQIWGDHLKTRKAKKQPMTETALAQMRGEAVKLGWTLERALQESCSRGWASFKADWVNKEGKHETTRGNSNGTNGKSRRAREVLDAVHAESLRRDGQDNPETLSLAKL